MLRAAELADRCALRGYDAIHCSSAEQLDDHDLVAASGDKRLLDAWRTLGVATFDANNPEDAVRPRSGSYDLTEARGSRRIP